jgi:hypothetical protein
MQIIHIQKLYILHVFKCIWMYSLGNKSRIHRVLQNTSASECIRIHLNTEEYVTCRIHRTSEYISFRMHQNMLCARIHLIVNTFKIHLNTEEYVTCRIHRTSEYISFRIHHDCLLECIEIHSKYICPRIRAEYIFSYTSKYIEIHTNTNWQIRSEYTWLKFPKYARIHTTTPNTSGQKYIIIHSEYNMTWIHPGKNACEYGHFRAEYKK